jgi:hypothetical protein
LLYTLLDTPGFQRARSVLDWLHARAKSAADHASAVRDFVAEHRGQARFHDECELLSPIVDGAGIIYVVDGSRPYGREYDAEMEILRWTGRPSMALINLIGGQDHVEQWRAVLTQYFKVVRVFDAWEADFDKQMDVLRAFSQLNDDWRDALDEAIAALTAQNDHRAWQAASAISETLFDLLTMSISKPLSPEQSQDELAERIRQELLYDLRLREQNCRSRVERIFNYHELLRNESPVSLGEFDLFDTTSWKVWGLSRRQLTATAAMGGAAAGFGADMAVGGTSALLGAAVGTLAGAIGSWWGFDKLAEVRVGGVPMGGRQMRVGPIKSANFPFVALGRALFHYRALASRTHAQTDPLVLDVLQQQYGAQSIPPAERKRLARLFRRISLGRLSSRSQAVEQLRPVLQSLLGEKRVAAVAP